MEVEGAPTQRVGPFFPGLLVTPNVTLVKLIGHGGMGSVWAAEHYGLNTTVAVKFTTPGRGLSDSVLKRFEREAQLAAQLKNPHVVQTFDYGRMDNGTPYIVMELLDGQSLGDRVERTGPLTLEELRLLVSQVTAVLTDAHELGIVHRDIKPQNVFLIKSSYQLFAKVLDFGAAKPPPTLTSTAVTGTGDVVGTPVYMSPELIESAKEADGQVDLWALAVTTYEAITGSVPFGGRTVGMICTKIVNRDYEPVSKLRPDLPAGLDEWFETAFARDVNARFASATAMSDALRDATRQSQLPSDRMRSKPSNAVGDTIALPETPKSEKQKKIRVDTSANEMAETLEEEPPMSIMVPLHSNTPLRIGIGIAVCAALAIVAYLLM
jgi:serine/threonine-protein kinase